MVRSPRAAFAVTLTAALLGAGVLAAAGPAQADPPSVPPYRSYVGVGSDTTQDVVDAIAGDAAGVTGTNKNIGSYGVFGSAQIKTTRTGPSFDRPAGSLAGVTALSDALTGTPWNGADLTGQVQFARSSVGPTVPGSSLTYVPFARDAVSYVYRGTVATIGRLTTAQLNAVYSADEPVTINGVQVTGVLPQSSSGTRRFFLTAIGVSTVGASVLQTATPENDGAIVPATNQVAPFSAARWIAQKNGVTTDSTAGVRLGAPNGRPAYRVDADSGLLVPSASFYNSAPYGRYVYNVIPTANVADGRISKVFVGPTSSLCNRSARVIVKRYGFAPITAASGRLVCGATSVTGGLTP